MPIVDTRERALAAFKKLTDAYGASEFVLAETMSMYISYLRETASFVSVPVSAGTEVLGVRFASGIMIVGVRCNDTEGDSVVVHDDSHCCAPYRVVSRPIHFTALGDTLHSLYEKTDAPVEHESVAAAVFYLEREGSRLKVFLGEFPHLFGVYQSVFFNGTTTDISYNELRDFMNSKLAALKVPLAEEVSSLDELVRFDKTLRSVFPLLRSHRLVVQPLVRAAL